MLLNEKYTWDKANQTLYRLVFPSLPQFLGAGLNDTKNFVINGNSALLPGLTLSSQEWPWQGGKIKIPDARPTFNDLIVSFLIDEYLMNWKLFFKWILYYNNNKDKYVEDPNNLVCDAFLIYYNNWLQKEVLKMQFINIFPTSLSDIELTTKTDGSDSLEGRVTFALDRYEIIDL